MTHLPFAGYNRSTAAHFQGLAIRSPTLDLQAALVEQAKKMTRADLKSAAVRCGKELSARGAEVTRIGHNISGLGGGNQ